jgi:hypothetical protein
VGVRESQGWIFGLSKRIPATDWCRERCVCLCGLMGRDGNALFALGDVLGGVVGVEGMRTAC